MTAGEERFHGDGWTAEETMMRRRRRGGEERRIVGICSSVCGVEIKGRVRSCCDP